MAANLCFINGRISSDIELKKTNSGKSFLSFSVAVKISRDITDFIPVTAYGETAEFIKKFFMKGDGINIAGKIRVNKWEDKDGHKRSSVYLSANEIGFPDGKKNESARGSKQNFASDASSGFTDLSAEDDEDLPF